MILLSPQIKDVNRQIKKAVVAADLDELQRKSSEKFGKTEMPQIHLDSDGTEIDDEDYFQTLEPNTDLIAVFSGERWIDVSLSTNWTSIYVARAARGVRTENWYKYWFSRHLESIKKSSLSLVTVCWNLSGERKANPWN